MSVPQQQEPKTTSSECLVYATLPKTAVILSFSQRQTLHSIYPLHPPVTTVNPLLHPMMDTDLSPSSFPCGDFCPTPVSSGRHHLTYFCHSPRASSVCSNPRAVLPGPFASHLYQCPLVWSCVNVCFVKEHMAFSLLRLAMCFYRLSFFVSFDHTPLFSPCLVLVLVD